MSTTTEPTPPTDPMLVSVNQAANPNDKPLTIAVVDQSRDINAAARDYVETRIREENCEFAENHGKIRKLLHNIWRGENGVATPYLRNKYYEEGKRIAKENGITSLYTDDKSLWEAATGATIDRFASEYDESIHNEAGESREELADDSPFGKSVKKLIENFAKGDSRLGDKKSFDEAKNRILRQLNQYGNGDGLIAEGDLKIDNIWEIAQAVKERIDHGESVDAVIQGMKIYSGESRSGVRTEAYQSKFDKVVEKVQSKAGPLVSPEAIGSIAAVATGVLRVGKGSLAKALGVTVLPGGLTGVLSGVREYRRLGKERSVHSREMAQGGSFDNESRREEMDEFRYNTVSAEHLTNLLREFIDRDDLSPEELQKGYESLVEAASRTAMSDRERADFISYSSAEKVEIERFDLDVAIAEAKVKLKGKLGELPEEFRRDLGIDKNDTINDAINKSTELMQPLSEDKDKKDQLFKRLRLKNTAKSAAIGFGSGLLASVAVQEVAAFFAPGYDGLLERAISGDTKGDRQTVLDAIFHREGSSGNTILSSDTYSSHSIGNGDGNVKLPDNYKFTYNDDGTANIIGPDNKLFAHNISFEANGSLSQSSQEYLQGKGVLIDNLSSTVDGKELMSRDLSVNEYLDHYHSKTTNITRDFWYDNNTPGVSDGNELNLHWEERGPDGSIRLSIADMTSDGSYYGYDGASWSDGAQNGSLKFAVSASIDNQDRVFMVDIAPDGSINIPPDSPAASLFSVDEHGQMEFNGAYGEVVSVQDVDSDGITHVAPMATMEGNNSITTIPTPVEVPTSHVAYETKMTFPPMEVSKPNVDVVEGFGAPWIVTRRPLEKIARRRSNYYNQYQYRNGYMERRESQLEDISPRLKENSNATLELGEEAARYKQWLASTRGSDYVDQIEQGINNSKELQQAPGDIDFVVTIPVAAASESENIYNTLGLLARQDSEDIEKSLILLNVNWLDEAKSDSKKASNIRKTIAEIDRARKDFPHLRIATIEREYNRESVEKTGGVIGYVAQDLQSAALLWLQQQIENGKRSPSQDAIIQRYDADIRGMSKHAWRDIRRTFSKYPETDIFKGVTRFGTDQYEKYPGFGLVMDMETNISAISAIEGAVHTGGANFGARASTVAAVNGIGDVRAYSGAGSDDVKIGTRIDTARAGRFTDDSNGGYFNYNGNVSVNVNRRVGRLIGGSTVDTDAERFISRYMDGKFWQGVWSNESGSGAFSDGAGGYSPRISGGRNRQNRSDKLSARMIKALELNMSEELSTASPERQRRVLSVLFKNAPGAYTLEDVDDGKVKFKFTKAGRKYIKEILKRRRNEKA